MNNETENIVFDLIESRKYADALAILEKQLLAEPKDESLNYHAGLCLRFLGRYDEAIHHYTMAAEAEPTMAAPRLGLGITQQLKGNYAAAVVALKMVIDLDPNVFEAYNSLGLTYRKMNEARLALDSYQAGIDCIWEAVKAEVHKDPARCYRFDGEVKHVLPYVFSETERLLKSNAAYAIMCNNRGLCHHLLGDDDQARESFEEAIECTPDGYDYPDPIVNLRNLN